MDKFFKFARQMLLYKGLLMLALCGAMLDAACAAGGFGSLLTVLDQLFDKNASIHKMALEKLAGLSEKLAALGVSPSLRQGIDGVARPVAELIPPDPFWGVASIFGLILILAVIGSAGRYLHQYCAITVSLRTVMRVRKQLFQRLVHLPLSTVSAEGMTDKYSRLVRDCGQLATGFNALTAKAVRDVFVGAAMLGVAVLIDWRLTAIFLLGAPPVAIVIRKFGKKIRRAGKRALAQYGLMLGAISESLLSLNVVKVHQAEGYERRRFNTINRRVLAEEMRARTARALASPVIEMIGMAAVMAVALVAAWYVFRHGRESANLVKVLMALGMAAASLRPLASLNNDLQDAAAAAGRIDEVLQNPVEPASRDEHKAQRRALPRHKASVAFDSVFFTYPTAENSSLCGVNLSVTHGQLCAVVGANGSGKSTLLNLLPRLYEPTRGRVLIDGVDIANVSLRSLRKQIAMVTQQTVLFDGSIADNLTYGSRHVTAEQMVQAAKRAFAHEFIMSKPGGYATDIGEWGGQLSGGQKQRIAIARAILRNPSLLILDEATSQIDADSESKIAASLSEFMTDRTTFVIAHRLSTVIHADVIAVMDAGKIVATGKHTELLRDCPTYRTLCQTQLHGLNGEA